MKQRMQMITRWMVRSIAGLLSFVLALVILVAVVLQGFVFWLNTDQGGDWMTARLNMELEGTGYGVTLKHFSLAGLWGLKAQSFELSQDGRSISTGQDVAFSINPTSISHKHLDINLKASALHIQALPISQDHEVDPKNTSFSIPDIYFKTAYLNINVKDFSLSDSIIAGGLHTHLTLKQNIKLGQDDIVVRGSVRLRDTQSDLALYLPQNIKNDIRFGTASQMLSIENFSVEQQAYKTAAQGQYNLQDKSINFEIVGSLLKPLTSENPLKNPVNVKAMINGRVEDFSGDISFSTFYQDHPVKITSLISRKGTVIGLANIEGTGASIKLEGAVAYNAESALADGRLNVNLPDLQMANQFVSELDLKSSATADVKIFSKAGKQAVSIDAALSQLHYEDYSAQNIKAKLRADDVKNLNNAVADIRIYKGRAAAIDIEKATLKLTTKDKQYHVSMMGNGYRYNPFAFDIAGYADTLTPLDIYVSKAIVRSGKGNINASGRIQKENLDIALKGERLALAQLPFVDLSTIPVSVDALSGQLTGSFSKPKFHAKYSFHPTIEEQYSASFKVESTFALGALSNSLTGQGRGVKTLTGQLDIPLTFSLEPFNFNVSKQAPLQGHFKAQSDLQALAGLFLDNGYIFKGDLNADTQISGTLSAPQLDGTMRLNNALFVDTYNDIQLNDIAANLTLKNQAIQLVSFTAKDGEKKGTMVLSGDIDFTDIKNPDIAASLQMDSMHLLKNENYDAWINADIDFKTRGTDYLISGLLSPQAVLIRIPDRFASAIPQLNIIEQDGKKKPTDTFFEKTKLDVKFKADSKIFVSGRGLDIELEGLLDIEGTLKGPLLEGNLKTVRGRYEEFGRRFDLNKAILRFQGAVPPSPYLDIEASTKVDDIIGRVLITNSIEDIKIKLTSTPSLPEDEVLSLILFGEDIQKISPFQAIQLANTLRKFSGKGGRGFDPLHQLQTLTGLDDIRVDSVGAEGATVGAGKYISERVYLEVEQGTAAGSSAASVEIEVTPNISVESKATQSGESDIGVFWEWDY